MPYPVIRIELVGGGLDRDGDGVNVGELHEAESPALPGPVSDDRHLYRPRVSG